MQLHNNGSMLINVPSECGIVTFFYGFPRDDACFLEIYSATLDRVIVAPASVSLPWARINVRGSFIR